jgi:hypothetical protein
MTSTVRIYYECLEQAYYFLWPIVQRVFGQDVAVQLIEISRMSAESVIAERLSESLSIRNPDGIISVIHDEVEIPLVWIEFSTQVETLDHLAQSFNSFTAAGASRIPVIKFYASRQSRSAHGGSQDFDSRIPFQILYSKYQTPGAQLNWPVTTDGRFAIRDADHRACPSSDLGLEEILRVCSIGVIDGIHPADALINHAIEQKTSLARMINENLCDPPPLVASSRSTRFYRQGSRWIIKFNRWDHSMDPERGLAELYHHWIEEKLIGRLHDKSAETIREALQNFRTATGIRIDIDGNDTVVDITNSIRNSRLNRAGLIIAWFCDEFIVADSDGTDIVRLVWDVSKPTGLEIVHKTASQTVLKSKTDVTEDEVTFVIANRALPANGWKVHSISYPGAQGDFALLTGSGRSARRKYFDCIATIQKVNTVFVLLLEAKGAATVGAIQKDVDTLLEWRDSKNRRDQVVTELGLDDSAIVISAISYPGEEAVNAIGAKDLDFTLVVTEESWSIFSLRSDSSGLFEVLKGQSGLPSRFKY